VETTSKRQRYVKRFEALKEQRMWYYEHWRELMEHIKPRRGRFLTSPSTSRQNDGMKKQDKIINGTPTFAMRILAAGMMAGITSPARPWFRLSTRNPRQADSAAARAWLHDVENGLMEAFARSNLYNCLHQFYEDLSTPGTAVLHVEEDADDLVRGYIFPIGTYCLANDEKLSVSTVFRETSFTVEQLARKFGLGRCSQLIKDAYQRGNLDQLVDVVHVIEPRTDYQKGKLGPIGKPWRSCWFEANASESDGLLAEEGFDEKPFVAARWEVNGEEVYGSSPAMHALPDCKGLQVLEKRKLEAAEKLIRPPMTGPSSLMQQRVSLLPGEYLAADAVSPAQQLRAAIEVNPNAVQVAELSIREHERRVQQAFFADLWLMMMNEGGNMTAREVQERHEEKMLQLGPVLERLQDELLDPLIDRVFAIGMRNNWFPPPPPELQGMDLQVEYLSILSQAQKLVGSAGVERLVQFVGTVYAVDPEVVDNIDLDKTVHAYGDMNGVKPDLLRTPDAVKAIRDARAQAKQAAIQQEQAAQAVQGAKSLSETDMGGDSALNRLMNAYGAQQSGGLPQ
jgi:hypothetical protein